MKERKTERKKKRTKESKKVRIMKMKDRKGKKERRKKDRSCISSFYLDITIAIILEKKRALISKIR